MTWYPAATVRRYRLDGGAMVGGPSRIVLHTTETAGVPRYGDPAGANSAPHFTVTPDGSVLQHHPISRAARALRNVAGGVQTNRQGLHNVQVEIVGWAKNGSNLPAPQAAALRRLVAWARAETGADARFRPISRGGNCYGATSPCRMSAREWVSFDGVCGHQEVPENTHWDPGAFDFATALTDPHEETAMQRGDRGNAVRKIQLALKAWNPDALPNAGADGDFGAETEEWVRRYQGAADLEPTGRVDGLTAAFLLEYVADVVASAIAAADRPAGAHEHPQYAQQRHSHLITGNIGPATDTAES